MKFVSLALFAVSANATRTLLCDGGWLRLYDLSTGTEGCIAFNGDPTFSCDPDASPLYKAAYTFENGKLCKKFEKYMWYTNGNAAKDPSKLLCLGPNDNGNQLVWHAPDSDVVAATTIEYVAEMACMRVTNADLIGTDPKCVTSYNRRGRNGFYLIGCAPFSAMPDLDTDGFWRLGNGKCATMTARIPTKSKVRVRDCPDVNTATQTELNKFIWFNPIDADTGAANLEVFGTMGNQDWCIALEDIRDENKKNKKERIVARRCNFEDSQKFSVDSVGLRVESGIANNRCVVPHFRKNKLTTANCLESSPTRYGVDNEE